MTKQILYLGLDPTHYSTEGQVTHWPIIRIVPRPLDDPAVYEALTHFNSFSHLVMTSKSTVFILRDYLLQLGIDLHKWKEKQTIAIGKITAKHLQTCGIIPTRVARQETAEGVIQELEQLSLKDAHFFWPHSAGSRPLITEYFTQNGITYTACPLYDTEPYLTGPVPSLDDFDEIVFTSPSTVHAFLKIFGAFPPHVQLIPIGPVTEAALNNLLHLPN
jgi:uroporphyrinogen-III synthase